MAERQVIGFDRRKLFRMNQPGANQPVWVASSIDVMPMSRCKLPTGGSRFGIGEGRHVGVIKMRAAPDLELELLEDHSVADVQTKNAHVGNAAESGTAINGI